MSDQDIVHAALRTDLSLFIQRVFAEVSPGETYLPNWHIDAMAHALTQVADGKTQRLIINIPPRHMKSIAASVALGAYILGHDPSDKIICASYSSDLALKLHNDTRRVMTSVWYRALFPGTVLIKDTQDTLTTSEQGGRWATSVGGALTGLGANYLIIDDPNKADDASSETKLASAILWFQNVAATRLNNPSTDCIIIVQQRIHEDDISGALLAAGGWTHLNLPAIAEQPEEIAIGNGKTHFRKSGDVLHPERMSRPLLDQMRSEMGSLAFATQYQQMPGPAGGSIIQEAWFEWYEELPDFEQDDHLIVQSWDTAHTAKPNSCFSVCTTYLCFNYHFYLIDVWREKTEFTRLAYVIPALAEEFNAHMVIIENSGAAQGLIQMLKEQEPELYRWWYTPKHDKKTRLEMVSPLVESGRIVLPRVAPWLPVFLKEMNYFPNGKYSDQVDSFSQALMWLRNQTRQDPPPPGMFVSYELRAARESP
jgi:predicted phage terminase large subunit-like protein